MNIENGTLQFHNYTSGTSGISGGRGELQTPASGNAAPSGNLILSQSQQGQTFTGKVVDVNGSMVTIQMEGGAMLQARLLESVQVSMGDTIAFLVKENTGNLVTIQPLASDMQAMKDQTIFELLEKNNLSPSDKNYQIAETMMNQNMSVDRASMQKVMQQSYKYPDTPIQTLVAMNKMKLPINEQTIAGFTQYQTNTHAMMEAVSGFTEELGRFLQALEGQTDLPQLYTDVIHVFSDAQDVANFDANAIFAKVQADGRTMAADTLLRAGQGNQMPDNAISAEQLSSYSEKFGITEDVLENLTAQLRACGLDGNQTEALLQKSETPMQLLNNIQELVKAAVTHSQITDETMQKLWLSDSFKQLLESAVKEKLTLHPAKLEHPQDISELYKSVYDKMDRLMQQLGGQNHSAGEQLSQSAKGMQERIDFLQNLSQLFPYAQIPVRVDGREGNADLFVYMNQKRIQEKKEDVSALLHLDMPYLGATDVHVSLRGTMVHTKFYVEDEISAKLLDEHMTMLEQAVAENGFTLTNEVIMRAPTLHTDTEKNAVIQEMFGDDMEQSVKRYSFDVRT